jgi:hypothetical protein
MQFIHAAAKVIVIGDCKFWIADLRRIYKLACSNFALLL